LVVGLRVLAWLTILAWLARLTVLTRLAVLAGLTVLGGLPVLGGLTILGRLAVLGGLAVLGRLPVLSGHTHLRGLRTELFRLAIAGGSRLLVLRRRVRGGVPRRVLRWRRLRLLMWLMWLRLLRLLLPWRCDWSYLRRVFGGSLMAWRLPRLIRV
jgi:hypothetical protein